MRFLFVKTRLNWPRTYGHDVHCFEMMRALGALGHEVGLVTDSTPDPAAVQGLRLSFRETLDGTSLSAAPIELAYLQERYRSYWGIPSASLKALAGISASFKPDVGVIVGLETLPYLAGVPNAVRVWYAADEWVHHYLSQIPADPRGTLDHVRAAAIKGLYERAYGPLMDVVWVVSEVERRAMRIVSGAKHVATLPNGVDAQTFGPVDVPEIPQSAAFWGRLAFGPNLQALRWFLSAVWPAVRGEVPDAQFLIIGADPPAEVQAMAGRDGITVIANPVDIRPEICRGAVAVMPFVSGGGIKNKFLEAAALGRPILSTKRAAEGLRTSPPAVFAEDGAQFGKALVRLWREPATGRILGAQAREWVIANHSWASAANEAVKSVALRATGATAGALP